MIDTFRIRLSIWVLATSLVGLTAACQPAREPTAAGAGDGGGKTGGSQTVVVYTSVDQVFSEPVLKAFEAKTGITVKAVYDVEADKTTGLVNRLRAEKSRPQADVWWNGEFAQTIDLAATGELAPYKSPMATDIPAQYVDAGGKWTGFGGRARIILVNLNKVKPEDMPKSIYDLVNSKLPGNQIGTARPVFGTGATQAAALYKKLGHEAGKAYFQSLKDKGVRIVEGNGLVRDLVVQGELAFGFTDTDDACGALAKGAPVQIVFPDQGKGEMGTLIIPNTVGLVAGGPNPDAGKQLIDYLLSPQTTSDLIKSEWFQVPLRPVADGTKSCVDTSQVKGMDVGLADISSEIQLSKTEMADLFVQ